MFALLTNATHAAVARERIAEFFSAHAEWFYSLSDNSTEALRRSELDVSPVQGRLILSCWTNKGTRTWRIRG